MKTEILKIGDLLTSSSTPGEAMKATKAGQVIGQAMEDFEGDESGKILAFIKTDSGNGAKLTDLIPGIESLGDGSQLSSEELSRAALNYFMNQDNTHLPEAELSEIMTDRVMAGLEVITPRVTANIVDVNELLAQGASISGTLTVDSIIANRLELPHEFWEEVLLTGGVKQINGRIETLEQNIAILTFEIKNLRTQIASISANSAVAGVSTESSVTSQSAELTSLQESIAQKELELTQLTNTASKSATASASGDGVMDKLRVTGSSIFEGVVTAIDTLNVGDIIITGVSNFLGETIFGDRVTFEDQVKFSNDTAGVVTIGQGKTTVVVKFTNEYDSVPQVTASLLAEGTALQKQAVLSAGYDYAITDVTTTGFTIQLNKQALSNVKFSWMAIQAGN
jgi:hypothetical protein